MNSIDPMNNFKKLEIYLQETINKIVNEEMPKTNEPLIKMVQSCRARTLMDVKEIVNRIIKESSIDN